MIAIVDEIEQRIVALGDSSLATRMKMTGMSRAEVYQLRTEKTRANKEMPAAPIKSNPVDDKAERQLAHEKKKAESLAKKVRQLSADNHRKGKIPNYDRFESVAVESLNKLKYENGYQKLVPVHLIRKDIGDRVSRTQFNDWMLKMHRSDKLTLHGEGSLDATEKQAKDSIYSDVLKTQYFHASL